MALRFVRPDTVRLPLADGEWILVKARLNHGERRAQYARLYTVMAGGDELKFNPLQTGLALVTAYLVDWSAVDEDGKPIAIRGLSIEDLERVLDNLEPASFREISQAIDAHDTAQAQARAQEKKLPTGANGAATNSPLPSAAAGAWTGSVS